MTTELQLLPLAGRGYVVLGLPQPMSLDALPELERVLHQATEQLRHQLSETAPEPGELEYASWLPVLRH